MVTLVKKVTTITEFGNNLQIRIEGLLSNGSTVGDGRTLEVKPGTERAEVITKHELTKINCEEDFEKHLSSTLEILNKTAE